MSYEIYQQNIGRRTVVVSHILACEH